MKSKKIKNTMDYVCELCSVSYWNTTHKPKTCEVCGGKTIKVKKSK